MTTISAMTTSTRTVSRSPVDQSCANGVMNPARSPEKYTTSTTAATTTTAEMNAGIRPSSMSRGLRAYMPSPRSRNMTPVKKSRPAPPTAFTGAATVRRDDSRSVTPRQ